MKARAVRGGLLEIDIINIPPMQAEIRWHYDGRYNLVLTGKATDIIIYDPDNLNAMCERINDWAEEKVNLEGKKRVRL